MDIEDSIIEVTDSIGPDYTDLAPEGEAHFDPVTIATLLACHILYAVGAGIKDGITEAAKDGTVAVLQASGRHIRDRLIPQRLRAFFTSPASPADTDAERAKAQQEAGDSLASAATAAGQLDPATIAQLAAATAAAVAQALQTAGLKDAASARVAQTIEAQVKITLTPVP